MPKRVLDVGQCSPDHASIRNFLTRNFNCEIVQVDDGMSTIAELMASKFDLVLVNRKLDIDYSDGIDIIRAIKENPATNYVPVMLITNYPEHQDTAIELGAIRGFGKLEFGKPETRAALAAILEN